MAVWCNRPKNLFLPITRFKKPDLTKPDPTKPDPTKPDLTKPDLASLFFHPRILCFGVYFGIFGLATWMNRFHLVAKFFWSSDQMFLIKWPNLFDQKVFDQVSFPTCDAVLYFNESTYSIIRTRTTTNNIFFLI